jgi:hypothetical protein
MKNYDEDTSIKQSQDLTQRQTLDNNTILTIEDVDRKLNQLKEQKALVNRNEIKQMKKKLKNKMKKNKKKAKKQN